MPSELSGVICVAALWCNDQVEAEVDNSGEADGSRVVATCTPAAGKLKAVKDACIAGVSTGLRDAGVRCSAATEMRDNNLAAAAAAATIR
jgi:hypothetical protein